MIMQFTRKIKSSFSTAEICVFPAFDKLSQYWKNSIVCEPKPLFEHNTDIVNGMFFDPAEFIPLHMHRWLQRRDMEGMSLPPGCYKIRFKVGPFNSCVKVLGQQSPWTAIFLDQSLLGQQCPWTKV